MQKVKRLIKDFKPEDYNLNLFIDSELSKATGLIEISGIRKSRPSFRITLHSKGIRVKQAKVYLLNKSGKITSKLEVTRIVHIKSREEVRIHTLEKLFSARYKIELLYGFDIKGGELNGLYPSTFTNDSGSEEKWLCTQFESHYARKMMPCIDEPEAKAQFNVSIWLNKELVNYGYEVILNETTSKEEVSAENLKNYLTSFELEITNYINVYPRWFKFSMQSGVVMSTYLLALAIGKFKTVEAKSENGTLVRCSAREDKFLSRSLEEAVKCLNFYEDFFGIKYPLSKLDLIAYPDFGGGTLAMENWGLLTFREDAFIISDSIDLDTRQGVIHTIYHEIAHQWFGNLVTMKWWDEIWLNEGFATWMEHFAVDHFYPEWEVWLKFMGESKRLAMNSDSDLSTKCIKNKIKNPANIENFISRSLSYDKPAALIQIIYELIGHDNFKEGLHNYLKKYSYKNTTAEDLWKEWLNVSGINISKIINPWLNQTGLPVLSFAKKDKGLIEISQERFLTLKSDRNKQKSLDLKWPIPIWPAYSNKKEDASLMLYRNNILIQQSLEDALLTVNSSGSGYYVTNYNSEMLDLNFESIENNSLSRIQKIDFYNNVSLSIEAGILEYYSLDLISKLADCAKNEDSPIIWQMVANIFRRLLWIDLSDNWQKDIKKLILNSVSINFEKLGFNYNQVDSPATIQLRDIILGLSSLAGDERTIKYCSDKFKEAGSIDDFEPQIRAIILNTVARQNNPKDFDKIEAWFVKHKEEPSFRYDLWSAMCLFRNDRIRLKLYEYLKNKNIVRAQDLIHFCWGISSSSYENSKYWWLWLTEEGGWEFCHKVVDSSDISYIPKFTAGTIYSTEDLKLFKLFFKDKETDLLKDSIEKSIERAKINIQFKESFLVTKNPSLNKTRVKRDFL
jgi:aminopeptidase N